MALSFLLVVDAAAKDDDCPSNIADFPNWYRSLVITITNPNSLSSINPVLNASQDCRDRWPAEVQSRVNNYCIRALENAANVMSKGIPRKPGAPPIAPLKVPKIFDNPMIEKFLTSSQSTPEQIAKVIAMVDKELPKEAYAFQFDSNVIKKRSFVFVIPDPLGDLVFHYHVEDEVDHIKSFLIFRIEKQSQEHANIKPPEINFFSYHYSGVNHSALNHCKGCHRSGSIVLLPKDGHFTSHEPGVSDEKIKANWNAFRPTEMDISNDDFSGLGVAMGPASWPQRTEQFVRQCATASPAFVNPPAESVTKIKNAMSCTGCHNYSPSREKILRYPMFPGDSGFVHFRNVLVHAHMPQGADDPITGLNSQERIALSECLLAEFFSGFTQSDFSNGNSEPGILLQSLVPPSCNAENLTKDGTPTGQQGSITQ